MVGTLLNSPDFFKTFKDCVDGSIGLIKEDLEATFLGKVVGIDERVSADSVQDASGGINMPLAGALPLMTKSAQNATANIANTYLDKTCDNSRLKTFGLIIFSGWE